ncbi:MAG: hypothetical protein J6I31_08465 [Prevotella sp.]|nr:hypothetical protein [Prevotella sp.]
MARNKHQQIIKEQKAILRKRQRTQAFWSAVLAIIALYIAYISPILTGEMEFLDLFTKNQATIGSFTANVMAIVCVVFNKFSPAYYIKGLTFAFSTLGFISAGYIYAQAVNVYSLNNTTLWWHSTAVTVLLHLLFIGMLFALSFSKKVEQSKKIYL